MLMCGSDIRAAGDKLQRVAEERFYQSLVCPKPRMASAVEQLRIVYTLDARRYSELKRALPYVVCGMFSPPFRRTENFAYTESLILDFDHLADKGVSLDELRKRVAADSRVMMCFASPSRDGLKVMFRLGERCYDSGLYSVAYRLFAADFARHMGLEQVLDRRTSDVTRACFASVDPDAYFNPDAEAVDAKAYANGEDPLAFADAKRQAETKHAHAATAANAPNAPNDPAADVMERIRRTLRPAAPPARGSVVVPAELDDIMDALRDHIGQTGIEVTEVVNIQYAKKIRARLGARKAELNLYHGRKGFSVVVSPRQGTDSELNNLLADVTRDFLAYSA